MASTLPDTVTADPANAAVARPRRGWLARLRRTDGEARPRPARVTVRKLGPVAALVRPIAMSLALLLAAYGLLSLGTTYWRGYERHLEHSQAVHADRSVFDVFFRSNLPPDAVDLVVRDMDGSLRRVVASRDATDGFVNDTILMLDEERDRIKRAAHADIDQAFDFAFADREQAVDAYADWFFEWKRSYVVLKDTLVSAATRFFTVGDYERLSEAVERDVKEYFMSHYMAQVLKPDLRDEPIVRALEQAARQAHDGFRRVAATNDVRLQLFLAQHTRHMADMPADRPMTRIALDWDAQRWKAPTYLMEDRAFAGIAGLGQAAAGGTVGALALGPVINRTVGTAFGALSKRFAASMGTRLAFARQGATAGGAVQPVSGHAVGAVAGVMVGFAADYFVNRADASFNRERFVTANHEALDATIETWKAGVKGNIDAAIDRWFDDMRASVVLAND